MAFTLIEILVVVAVIAILITVLIPVLSKALESSRRAKCAANLHSLGLAIQGYNVDNGEYPRTSWRSFNMPAYTPSYFGSNQVVVTAFSGARGYDPFNGSAPAGNSTGLSSNESSKPYDNDVTAALFLLVRQNRIVAKQFICPSASSPFTPDVYEPGRKRSHGGYPDNNKMDIFPNWRSNFTNKYNLSYSYTIPYPSRTWDENGTSAMSVGYRYDSRMNPQMALAADLNPGNIKGGDLSTLTLNANPSVMALWNSLNHAQAGQNVLYATGDVQWAKTPFAGANADNIYTRAAGSYSPTPDRASDVTYPYGGNPPSNVVDNILLPTQTALTNGTMTTY